MRPLRRAKPFRRFLGDLAAGTQSATERDVSRCATRSAMPDQSDRPGGATQLAASGSRTPSGDCRTDRVVVLEIDGGFHMRVEHWSADIERERQLVATGRDRAPVHRARAARASGIASHATSARSAYSGRPPEARHLRLAERRTTRVTPGC